MAPPDFELVTPSREHLESYVGALESGWGPDSTQAAAVAEEQLRWIARDPDGFLASLDDPEGKGEPVRLKDGSHVPRLPGVIRWMWGGEFVGMISLRWQAGTADLPPHCLGHIGFNVPSEKRCRGYATQALAAILPEARRLGLPYVELTTTPDNAASRRVIEKGGGVLIERVPLPPQHGEGDFLRFRIAL